METLLLPSLRFGHYLLLLGLFGLTAYAALWQRALGLQHGPHIPRPALMVGLAATTLVSAALMLAVIGEMMGQPALSLEVATVKALVTSTPMGRTFLIREALLIAAVVLLVAGRDDRLVTVVLALAVATLAWSGHAAATDGTIGSLHRASDIVHLLAVGLWFGAVAGFLFDALATRRTEIGAPANLLLAMQRFAPWGVTLVATVTITGIVNAGLIVDWDNLGPAIETPYGQLMLAKLVVVGLILLCAATNAALARRQSRSASSTGIERHTRTPVKSLTAELILMTAALAIVAALGLTSPAS
jgi:putative copper resistance protein D